MTVRLRGNATASQQRTDNNRSTTPQRSVTISPTTTTRERRRRRQTSQQQQRQQDSSWTKSKTTTLEDQLVAVLTFIATVLACCVLRLLYLQYWASPPLPPPPSPDDVSLQSSRTGATTTTTTTTTKSRQVEDQYAILHANTASSSSEDDEEGLDAELLDDYDYDDDNDDDDILTLDDLELLEMVGYGAISLGFRARVKGSNNNNNNNETNTNNNNNDMIVKINHRHHTLHYSDTEMKMFQILNAPPTIPNIPKMKLALQRISNPFKKQYAYLTIDLKTDKEKARLLSTARRVSIIVMDYLEQEEDRWPETVEELRIFLKSLLTTLEFAHSRNIIMGDLHEDNVYFDGEMVKIFDWNGGLIFEPDMVEMDFEEAPHHLMPPEAKKGNVHRTVSGFDIWTVGLLLGRLMDFFNYTSVVGDDDEKKEKDKDDPTHAQIVDLRDLMLKEDPYERPDATQLLRHEFFLSTPIIIETKVVSEEEF